MDDLEWMLEAGAAVSRSLVPASGVTWRDLINETRGSRPLATPRIPLGDEEWFGAEIIEAIG